MAEYRFTDYFEKEVLRKRPYLKKEWCIRAVEQPIRSEPQEHNRYRFWAEIAELEGPTTRSPTGGSNYETKLLSRDRVVLDYDSRGNLAGIDIDNASTKVELHRLIVSKLPASVETIAG